MRAILAAEVEKVLGPVAKPLVIDAAAKPFVILVVGVNGSGKTTTIGKLAARFRAEDRKVMLAAGDTFRAAAIEQLKIWGSRAGATVIAREQGSDAASLAFEALTAAKRDAADILIVDTAGRLQNKAELMAELEKLVRVMKKVEPAAPHAVLLVLDATVGQNALSQATEFTRRRRHRPGDDQARRHRARRHFGGARRQAQTAGALHRRRRGCRGPFAVCRQGLCQRDRGDRVVITAHDNAASPRYIHHMPANAKPQLNPLLKLALDMGPLILFFFANSRPALFMPFVGPFLPAPSPARRPASSSRPRCSWWRSWSRSRSPTR